MGKLCDPLKEVGGSRDMNNWVVGAEDENVGTIFGEINDDHRTPYSRGLEVMKWDGSPEVLEIW
jgi:hypothetical protein